MTIIHLKTHKELHDILTLRNETCIQIGVEKPELIAATIEHYIDSLEWDVYKEVLELLHKRYYESPFGDKDILIR